MTKTEFKGQGVEDLRAALLDLFEDEDGSLASATKASLSSFVDDNWEYIDSQINPPEEEPDAEEEEDDEEAEAVEEEDEEEVLEEPVDPTKPNPKTDLYTGRMRGVDA